MPLDFSFIFEFDSLSFLAIDRDELEVNQRFKLNVRTWLQSMQVQKDWILVAFCRDLNDIMEISFNFSFKTNVHFDG